MRHQDLPPALEPPNPLPVPSKAELQRGVSCCCVLLPLAASCCSCQCAARLGNCCIVVSAAGNALWYRQLERPAEVQRARRSHFPCPYLPVTLQGHLNQKIGLSYWHVACVGLKSGKARTSLQHRLPAETGREPGESRESNKTGVEQGDMQRKQLTGHASKRVYDWQSGMAHWGETQRYGSMGWPNGSAER